MSQTVLAYLTAVVLTVSAKTNMEMYSNVKFEYGRNNPMYSVGTVRSASNPYLRIASHAPEFLSKGFDPTSHDEPKVLVAVIAVFRMNLIKLFGYVLHRPNMKLSTDLYTSLYFILLAIKMNDVDLFQLAPRLHKLSFMESNERFVEVFSLLEQYLPLYLTCAATLWKDAIKTGIVNMHNILVPYKNGFLIVDLFDNITPIELQIISKVSLVAEPKNEQEQEVVHNFNPNVLHIFRIMKNYTRSLTPWLIGSALHFFPKREPHLEVEESILVVDQYLRQVSIKEWNSYRKKSKHIRWENPYEIIRFFLERITGDKSGNTHYVIKNAAHAISYSFCRRNPTAINGNYHTVTALLQPEIDPKFLLVLLNYISIGQYPKDAVFAAHRFQYYLDQCNIRYLNAVFCFNPYMYNSAPEILMALSLRILKKQSDLALEILDSIGAVYSSLLFNYRSSFLPATMPDDIFNINSIILGVRSPDILDSIRNTITSQTRLLMLEPADYYEILKKIPPYKCFQPSLCFTSVLDKMYKLKMFRSALLNLTSLEIISSSCRIGHCPIETNKIQTNVIPENIFRDIQNGTFDIIKYDKKHILSSIIPTDATEGPLVVFSTLRSTLPTTPTPLSANIFSPSQTVPDILVQTLYPTIPPEFFANMIIKSNIQADAANSKKLLEVMKSSKYQKYFKEHENHHTVLLTLYMEGLQKIVDEGKTLDNKKIDKHFEEFLVKQIKMLTSYKIQLHYKNVEMKPSEPSLRDLVVAIPVPTNNDMKEKKRYIIIKAILDNQELFKLVEKKISKDKYTSIGLLLKTVLGEFAKLETKFTKDKLEVIKYFCTKVQMKGFGEGKITYIIPEKQVIKRVELLKTLENGIDLSTLTIDQRFSLYTIVKYLMKNIDIAQSFHNGYLYTTCGEFTKEFFKYLLERPNTPVKVADSVENLIPNIVFDKTGELPAYE
ncbi:hypothetical protein ILUMI_00606 [Ignelater luminosus]|uniref:Uncharacterized protein n=1 Tax=Ignelater luminosus TaxID=2038154 RepID=A0A8K0DG43_IGNLU|nr:hypothetical protein ILUMI_00606 [Ignelater luminosus]